MDHEMKEKLNDLYRPVVARARLLLQKLRADGSDGTTCGFYDGHYAKGPDGAYAMEWFPIPVVSVPDLCDVEFALDHVGVTAKLTRAGLAAFDFALLSGRRYDIYGVCDYLSDFGDETVSASAILSAVAASREAEIAFAFTFDKDADLILLHGFVRSLGHMGFYY